MKIVFTLASLGSGGAERVVSLLANKMAEQGHQVEIICLKFNDVYYELHPDVKVTLAMEKTKNRLTEVFWLRKYIKQEKPDVVIAFTEGVYCFTIATHNNGSHFICPKHFGFNFFQPHQYLCMRMSISVIFSN